MVIHAYSLFMNILAIIPLIAVGGTVAWLSFAALVDAPHEITLVAGYGMIDCCLVALRRRSRVELSVPLCNACAARLRPTSWAHCWWFRPLGFVVVAMIWYVALLPSNGLDNPARFVLLPLIAAPPVLATVLTRAWRIPASAVVVDEVVDITFLNPDFGRDVKQLNRALQGAG